MHEPKSPGGCLLSFLGLWGLLEGGCFSGLFRGPPGPPVFTHDSRAIGISPKSTRLMNYEWKNGLHALWGYLVPIQYSMIRVFLPFLSTHYPYIHPYDQFSSTRVPLWGIIFQYSILLYHKISVLHHGLRTRNRPINKHSTKNLGATGRHLVHMGLERMIF